MIVQNDDVFALLENEEIAKAKQKVAQLKAEKERYVSAMLTKLSPFFDQMATERTLYFASAAALGVTLSFKFFDGEPPKTPLGAVMTGGASGAFSELNKLADQNLRFDDPAEKVIKENGLNEKAAAAFLKGATIGELFLLQPRLFLVL